MGPQQIQLAWYREPLFYQLDAVDLLVVLCIGILWSGAVWTVTEAIKERLAIPKPYPAHYRSLLSWVPIVVSGIGAVFAFPLTMQGVGQPMQTSVDTTVAAFCVGVVGGFGSKAAHELAHGLMRAAYDRATRLIRGRQDDRQ
jgi:hypothetical protein